MPTIQPIPAIRYATSGPDVSALIAPPYDVLDHVTKPALLRQSEHNIVAVDLPHLPAKALGPDAVYVEAGRRFRAWLDAGVLKADRQPGLFVYQQTYAVDGLTHRRRGVFANVAVQPFGPSTVRGQGGIHPHEQTFAAAKQDRLKLMQATGVQLSPIFGIYSDAGATVATLLEAVIAAGPPMMHGTTPFDQVRHEVWRADDAIAAKLVAALTPADIFIADGHHRYNTALNYLQELERSGAPVPERARYCMFVLVAMQDAGMIVLPTHRVLGGMTGFTFESFRAAAQDRLVIEPFDGADLSSLEAAINSRPAADHAMGLIARDGAGLHLAVAATPNPDPLRERFPQASDAWRSLDVAIVQHVLVEQVCQAAFSPGQAVSWKFPHELSEVEKLVSEGDGQLGVVLRPTPLDAVRRVAEAGELMPQKSTFFYPKLATGLIVNPLS